MAIVSKSINVDHIEISSARPVDEVAKRLEGALPPVDPDIAAALAAGDLQRIEKLVGQRPLFIFLKRDHGALLRSIGQNRQALQYEIGNPLTASKMTRHRLAAALYAPLRVSLFDNDAGGSTFAYDQPSTLFGQFGDDRIAAVALSLDQQLQAALLEAAQ